MIFVKDKSRLPDIGDLHGDPFIKDGTIIHDRPDLSAVNADLEAYDNWVDQTAAAAGVTPGTEAYEAVTQAVRAKDMIGGDVGLMQDGHVMPMQRRDFLEYSGGTVREVVGQQQAFVDSLLAEYAQRWPELAQDTDALSAAVDAVNRELQQHYREVPQRVARERRNEYLERVATAQQLGHGRRYSTDTEHGRTAGIGGSGGGYAPEPSSTDGSHPYDNPDSVGMVAELRALQRTRGIL